MERKFKSPSQMKWEAFETIPNTVTFYTGRAQDFHPEFGIDIIISSQCRRGTTNAFSWNCKRGSVSESLRWKQGSRPPEFLESTPHRQVESFFLQARP
jgi:hypothetical protein